MDFILTIDKKIQSEIDSNLCINCGKCREYCPTGAINEYQKTVSCLFADCGEGKGSESPVKYYDEAADFSVETACSTGCPLGIVPQAAVNFVKNGDVETAYEYISERNPLPWVCSQVCDHYCHDVCKRGTLIDEPVNMQEIEGYILSKVTPKPHRYINRGKEKIAVIGGGPAGITAAFDLSKAGYRVTIFEKDNKLGGAMSWGIPQFRLDKQKLEEEIQRVITSAIEVRYGCEVGRDIKIEDIWAEGFSACLIAAGSSSGLVLDIKGINGKGIYDAVAVLRMLNGIDSSQDKIKIGNKVIIIGGGGLATDTARLLARQGKEVICAAIDDPEDPQTKQQMQVMEAEDIEYRPLLAPKQIILENNEVKAVELTKIKFIEDDNGWVKPIKISGSEYNVFCDTVIFAVGQRSHVEDISKVETYPSGKVKINDFHKTNKDMIFACGDVTGESGSVVEAMAAGRQAAASIDAALHGRNPNEREHEIFNAPPEDMIYPGNIQAIRPQFSQKLINGKVSEKHILTDDIMPMLKSAGIEGNMAPIKNMTRQKIAIAGGGIAGITAAISLAKKGYRPTIFEKLPVLGGSYRTLATDMRLDRALLAKELEKVEKAGIKVVYNAAVGVKPTIEELSNDGYAAVLFAIGETAGRKPEISNADAAGVFDIITLMGKLADNEHICGVGNNVIVLGNDEMSFDAARTLKAMGSNVTIAANCSRGGLQVATSAVNIAAQEGINIITGVEISRINAEEGAVKSIDLQILQNKLSTNVKCDTLVIGGTAVADTETIAVRNPRLKIGAKGHLEVDDRLNTGVKGVFAIGDFNMSSPDAGRAGAAAIDNYIADGRMSISVEYNKPREVSVEHEIIEGHVKPYKGFETGKLGFTDAQAKLESSRCMNCGYHRGSAAMCMGCGICAKVCPVNAVKLVAAEAVQEVK